MDLTRGFSDRAHHIDHINNLKVTLFTRFDRFLSGDHHHWHGSQLGVSRGGNEVGGTWSKGGEAHP